MAPTLTIRIYTQGGCYAFYQLLKNRFPQARAYCAKGMGHIYVKIGSLWYDIKGYYTRKDMIKKKVHPLSKKAHEYGQAFHFDELYILHQIAGAKSIHDIVE